MTTAPPSAGVIMSTGLFRELLITLRKESSFLKALPETNVIRMEDGNLVLPKMTDDGTASWVAEGSVIPRTDGVLASNTLKAWKLARITSMTSEALEDSGLDARAAINAALLRSIAAGVDDAMFSAHGHGSAVGSAQRRGYQQAGPDGPCVA
ncbi:phage major capsid protein [Yinghuangia aomiensis]